MIRGLIITVSGTFLFYRIGVTEKGWMDVKIEASGIAGHSSIPPKRQVTHSLATAIHNLYSNPQPTSLKDGPEEQMFLAIAPKVNNV